MDYPCLTVEIVRFISDEPIPGMVACEFTDADGHRHTLIDKAPIFSLVPLDASSTYPQAGVVRCEILAQWKDANKGDLTRISLVHPDDVESTGGLSEFVVLAEQLSS
jgi:hypothetical protein